MLSTYYVQENQLKPAQEGDLRRARWIDLFDPSLEEEKRVEEELGISIPTREEMREVESSSELYRSDDAVFITIRVVERGQAGGARLASFTLILAHGQFISLRYAHPKSFSIFLEHILKPNGYAVSAESLLLCLLETIVDRNADILEEVSDKLEPVSFQIFSGDTATNMDNIAATDLSRALKKIGSAGETASRVRQSLHSIGRALPFLKLQIAEDEKLNTRLRTMTQDVQSLLDHDNFLQTQIQFLLDSNIGLISIQQNAIMKTLSVAAVVFLPPTLIGSIFGMNFQYMPELRWHMGYPYALGLMIFSAVCPLIYFRLRRWL